MNRISFLFGLFFLLKITSAQVENVPLYNPVYDFLKGMNVKKIISTYNDDNPNLSRNQILNFLNEASNKSSKLSSVEKKSLEKYLLEFDDSNQNSKNTTSLIGGENKFSKRAADIFSDKEKFLYKLDKKDFTLRAELLSDIFIGNEIKPNKKNTASLYDIGIKLRGTIANKVGYYLDTRKGVYFGNRDLAALVEPRLKTNFKFLENKDKDKNFDFTEGHLKLQLNPVENLFISVQLGREKITYGYGLGSKLVLSGDNPPMDFYKLNVSYGILSFSHIYASTVGDLSSTQPRYTKYFVAHRIKVNINNVVELGVGESVIFSRPFEIAYLNPLLFYKFTEHSLQDRDNNTIHFDIRTRPVKNFELYGTLFMDEFNLVKLGNGSDFENKFAFQTGFFWYEAATIRNLSFAVEYTKIRPYVYTHRIPEITYDAFGVNLGHRIGPNADEIFSMMSYNVSSRLNLKLELAMQRAGNNIYNSAGDLIKNVGGDIKQPRRDLVDSEVATFLDGIRVNTKLVNFILRFEPLRNYIFELNYSYRIDENISTGVKSDYSFGSVKLKIEY